MTILVGGVIMPDNGCITQIICGIQFVDSFKMFDKWGEIVDSILSSSNSKKLLGEGYYNQISNDVGYQRALINASTHNSLRLTQNNLIITHNVSDTGFEEAYTFVQNMILKYIFPEIITDNYLIVRRIGIVFTCELNNGDITKYKKTVIKNDLCESITDFRFSKKEPVPQGSIQKDNNSYINKIITVGNLDEKKHGISYDYQYFYLPPTAEAYKKSDTLFDLALKSLNNDIFDKIGE